MDKFEAISREIARLIKEDNNELIVNKYLELKEYVTNNYPICDESKKLIITINIEMVKYSISYDKNLAKTILDESTHLLKYGDDKVKYDYYTYYSLFDEKNSVYYLKKALKYSDDYGTFEVSEALFERGLNSNDFSTIVKDGKKLLDLINKTGYGMEKRCEIATCIGLSYTSLDDYKKALKYLFLALDYLDDYDKNYNESIFRIYDNIAYSYEKLAKFNKALQYYIYAFDFAKKLDDDRIIKTLISIAECAHIINNFPIELEYLKKMSKYLDGERLFINKCRIFTTELKLLSFDTLKNKIKKLTIEYESCINDDTKLHYAIACVSYYRYLRNYNYNDITWLKEGIKVYESIEEKTPEAIWFLLNAYCLYGISELYSSDKIKHYLKCIDLFEENIDKVKNFDCYDIYNSYLNLIDISKPEDAKDVLDRFINILNIANPNDKKTWLASAYFRISDLYNLDAQKCIDYHEKAIEILKDSKAKDEIELLSEIYTSLSYFYESIEEINLAIEIAKKNVDICKKIDDLYISDAYNQLSYYYDVLGDYESEKKTFEEEIDVLSQFPESQLYLGEVYSKYASLLNYDLNDNYLAIKYYEMAIKILLDHNLSGELSEKIADQYFGLATSYWELNDGEESLNNYFKSLHYLDDSKRHKHTINGGHYAIVLRGIAFIYNQLENVSEADTYYKKAIDYAEKLYEDDLSVKDILLSIYQRALDFYKRTMNHTMQKQLEEKLEALDDSEEIVS